MKMLLTIISLFIVICGIFTCFTTTNTPEFVAGIMIMCAGALSFSGVSVGINDLTFNELKREISLLDEYDNND